MKRLCCKVPNSPDRRVGLTHARKSTFPSTGSLEALNKIPSSRFPIFSPNSSPSASYLPALLLQPLVNYSCFFRRHGS